MDERSARDDSVLLVRVYWRRTEDGETVVDEIKTVRASFKVSGRTLMCLEIAKTSVDECLECAQWEEDGIYRERNLNWLRWKLQTDSGNDPVRDAPSGELEKS
jgi:hypothetical protein